MDKKLLSKIKEISPSLTKEEKISEIKKIIEEKFDINLKGLPFNSGLTLTMAGANSNVLIIYE